MKMAIRTLHAWELDTAKEIWLTCFDDQPAFVDWYFAHRVQPHEVMGYFQDATEESLLANLHMAPYQLRLRNTVFSSAYLIALATRPEYRRRGIAKELLSYTLTHLAGKGIYFTILLPFDLKFYTRLGWGIISRRQTVKLKSSPPDHQGDGARASSTPAQRHQGAEIRRFDSFTNVAPEIPQLQTVYEKWADRFAGLLLRQPRDWSGLLFDHYLDGGEVLLSGTSSNGQAEPTGYALVLPTPEATTIREIAYIPLEAGEEILRYLSAGQYPDTCRRLTRAEPSAFIWTAPGDDPLVDALTGKVAPKIFTELNLEKSPYMLGRITDLAGFIRQLPHPGLPFQLRLEVHDPLLPQNCGVFELYPGENGRFGFAPSSGPPEISCGISFLTGLLVGETLSLTEQDKAPSSRLWVREKKYLSLLRKVFPQTINYFHDYF